MLGKELAEICNKYPDFDFQFIFTEESKEGDTFPNIKTFNNLIVGDIGHSDKVVLLTSNDII